METDHHSPIKWCLACYICYRRFWPHLHWRRFSVSRNDSFVSGFSSAMAAARNINQPWFFVLGCFNQCNGVRFENATYHLILNKIAESSHSLWNPSLNFTFHWYSTHWVLLVDVKVVTVTFEDICSILDVDVDVDLVVVVDFEIVTLNWSLFHLVELVKAGNTWPVGLSPFCLFGNVFEIS